MQKIIAYLLVAALFIGNFFLQNKFENTKLLQGTREIQHFPNDPAFDAFNEWKDLFGKQYDTLEEETFRFGTFKKNFYFIKAFNSENNGISLGMNQFGDQTFKEFKSLNFNHGFKKSMENAEVKSLDISDPLPSSINWVQLGAVTPVKNQGQCGSCWAFSTVGGLEGIYEIRSKKLVSMSEQQIVDCSHNGGNEGCNGGDLPPAYQYVVQNGIESETSYPYKGVDGKCKFNATDVVYKPTSFTQVPQNNSDQLAAAVVQQPISVCIEADSTVFQFYTGGVITSARCGTNLDHCVTLVGYQNNSNPPYWIVKNSWGRSWGQQGYVWIEKQSGTGPGICGIAEEGVYPNWTGQQSEQIM